MKRILYLILFSSLISGCLNMQPKDLKSPCVAIVSDNPEIQDPCIRRPVNSWQTTWLS